MAKDFSFMKLEGTLDNVTFYQKNGETIVKKKSRVSRNRIMNDPTYKRTRENMKEFGGAAKVGKAFREAFGTVIALMGDTYVSARLNGIMKRINLNSPGERGRRDFEVVNFSYLLDGFDFNKRVPLSSHFFAPHDLPVINGTRNEVTFTVPDFEVDSYIRYPEGATHFRLLLASGYVSDYEFDTTDLEYQPVDASVNGRGVVTYSAYIPLSGMVGSPTVLVTDLSTLGAIPATSALFSAIGIVFYQETNGDFYEFAQDNAMKVVVTG